MYQDYSAGAHEDPFLACLSLPPFNGGPGLGG